MKRYLFMLCLIALSCQVQADNRPPWMRGDMPPRSNDSYYFKVTSGEGTSLSRARNNAILALVGEMARSQGVRITGRDVLRSITSQTNRQYSEETTQSSTYNIETDAFRACFEMVDEYVEGRVCWVLFAVANNPDWVQFDRIEFTTNYNGYAFLRSMIVPGWGQMYKHSMAKGVTILSLELVSVAGIFVCDNLSSSYYHKALGEHNSGVREQYMDRHASYRNIRNGFIVAAGAVYVFNIVDAISAKGAKRYKVGVSPQGFTFSINL
jgi:hypothetical protein